MTTPPPELRAVPAQLSFLTIYNPSLAHSDDTFGDQILFYFSRAAHEARAEARAGGGGATTTEDELREQDNERMRQVGLAQGMVDFARTFSNGQAVDSVETAKSRLVMKELEDDWWVLASVDLTKLPRARASGEENKSGAAAPVELYEYSSREVSPPALLVQQILTAHRTFSLHHGPSLTDLLSRNGREKLATILDRFWSRFCRNWEVMLHGNPAVDALGATKLSSGGELGMGVGEEEWGSGEREVLEDLVGRTEGLVDLVVSRFGNAPGHAISSDDQPWLGRGQPPDASDGVVFGGVGAISRASVREVSCWLQQIYTYGDHAYGVKDNPSRRRRKRNVPRGTRRAEADFQDEATRLTASVATSNGKAKQQAAVQGSQDEQVARASNGGPAEHSWLPPNNRPALHDRVASQDHAPGNPSIEQPLENHRPDIPPPVVTAAETALVKATLQAEQQPAKDTTQASMASDKWVKYLTLGLSTLVKADPDPNPNARPSPSKQHSTSQVSKLSVPTSNTDVGSDNEQRSRSMTRLEPMPDGYLAEAKMAQQKHFERQGYYLIGYQGALDNKAIIENGSDANGTDEIDDDAGERLLLRTIHVEQLHPPTKAQPSNSSSDGSSVPTLRTNNFTKAFERVRVVVYVKQPFIYAFLFEQRAGSLQMASSYITTHEHLAPLHKSMSMNTSSVHIDRLMEGSKAESSDADASGAGGGSKQSPPIYDLLYDPARLTVHSSIPNIPLPGTSAAEGLPSDLQKTEQIPAWTRIDSLNVHSQILSTIESAKHSSREIERAAKTSRGWWVVWMRLAPSKSPKADPISRGSSEAGESQQSISFARAEEHETSQCRVALLVRKASDWTAPKTSTSSGRAASGMFGFGRADDGAGANASWGPAGLAGGMGFDARRYVEGLLSLNR